MNAGMHGNEARELWPLPFKSQEFMDGPQFLQTIGELRLRLDHETEVGTYTWSAIVFRGVYAFNFTAHASCRQDQVRAYDRLMEIVSSEWLSSLGANDRLLRHFRIYFD